MERISGSHHPSNSTSPSRCSILCMVILGGMGNMWGVILWAIVIYMLQTEVLIHLPDWLSALGKSLNIQFLVDFSSRVHLTDYTFFIYGIILVLFMLFRPEGLLPSSRRRAGFTGVRGEVAVNNKKYTMFRGSKASRSGCKRRVIG